MFEHVHVPVRRDHEVVCYDCGQVLESMSSFDSDVSKNGAIGGELVYPGLDILMVGNSFHCSKYWKGPYRNKILRESETVLDTLLKFVEQRGIHKKIAYETMRKILKNKRGLYSFRIQIRNLIEVLDEYDLKKQAKEVEIEFSNILRK